MDPRSDIPFRAQGRRGKVPRGFRDLLHEILAQANRNFAQPEALRHICAALLPFSNADAINIRINDDRRISTCQGTRLSSGAFRIEMHSPERGLQDGAEDKVLLDAIPEPILSAVLTGSAAAPAQSFTPGRSFWTGDAARPVLLRTSHADQPFSQSIIIGGDFPSLALYLIPMGRQIRGILLLASRKRDFFSPDDMHLYEVVAETVGVALVHQGTQWALQERIKELTCLYGIERVASRPGIQLDEILTEIVKLLPPGWQYPDITRARIVLDSRSFTEGEISDRFDKQTAKILVSGRDRGSVEVFYCEKRPDIDEGPFLLEERNLIDAIAETIGRLVAQQETQWALRERVKELTCLYGISTVASRPAIPMEEFLAESVALLPPGWQFPEITQGCIVLDGKSYSTAGYQESPYRQSADILIDDMKRGTVTVSYSKEMPAADEGPFLKEERSLLNAIARHVGFIVEYWEAEQETRRLQEQLRHAERLATVGQLSAGIAHELNEPLAAILGFAELLKESAGLSDQGGRDLDKIVNAALHAREVIRKLMIFTRQMPTRKESCDLNKIVSEGLYFLEARCAKEGIRLVRNLEDRLPAIAADPSQLHQVLVNLVVNAIQAMPEGGRLTIATRTENGRVCLAVTDTGKGMSPEVQAKLFIPFFTTKDVGQGTGLGLPVVHGIVSAHGGSIKVFSEVGAGSTFEIHLPVESPGRSREH